MRGTALLVTLLLVSPACDRRAEGEARASAPAEASAEPNPRSVGRAELRIGDEIEICWRKASSSGPFSRNDAAYGCSTKVRAAKAPWAADAGGVHGRLLTDALRRSTPLHADAKAWLRSVEPNRDPREPASGIALDDSESSYFNEFVGVDASGTARVYVELESP